MSGGVQGYDRYAYANNSPVVYTDPSGHYVCPDTDACTPSQSGSGGGESKPNWPKARAAGYSEWEISALIQLYANGGPAAASGVNYILANHVHILTGHSLLSSTGAWFDETNNTVTLNSDPIYYLADGSPTNYSLSLIIHEARHLEQGPQISHSKLGEWDAWQIQADVIAHLAPKEVPDWGPQVRAATTVEAFSQAVQKYQPGYWNRAAGTPFCIGLCMYPDSPDLCDSLASCGYITPWWASLHPIP